MFPTNTKKHLIVNYNVINNSSDPSSITTNLEHYSRLEKTQVLNLRTRKHVNLTQLNFGTKKERR